MCVSEKANVVLEADQYYQKTIDTAEMLVNQSRNSYERSEALASLRSAYNSIIEFYQKNNDSSGRMQFQQRRDATLQRLNKNDS